MIKFKNLLLLLSILFAFVACDVSGGSGDDKKSEESSQSTDTEQYQYSMLGIAYDAYDRSIEIPINVTSPALVTYDNNDTSHYYFSGGDRISITISSPGYITKTIEVEANKDQHTTWISEIELFSSSLPLTTVSGKVTFKGSITTVSDVYVKNRIGDSYDYVLTDALGNYTINVYHRGTIELEYSKTGMQNDYCNITTVNSLETNNVEMGVSSDYWTEINGYIKDFSDASNIANATVSIGKFSTTTTSSGYYDSIYLYKGTTGTLEVSCNGYKTHSESINSYANTLTKNVSLEQGTSGGNTGGTSYLGNVTLTGTLTDLSGTSLSGGSLTANVTNGSINNGSYTVSVDTTSTEGNIIIQVGMFMGYNLYSHSVKAESANEVHNIKLTPTTSNPQTTTFTGYIRDSETGSVPADLSQFTLTAGAQTVNINSTTGEYSVTVSNHFGAVTFQGGDGNNKYHILRRTASASGSTANYDVEFDPK